MGSSVAVILLSAVPLRADLADVRIAEVKPGPSGGSFAELLNVGPEPVSLDGAFLASDDSIVRLGGLAVVPPGEAVVVHWNATGTTGGREFFTGTTSAWTPTRGNLSLHRSSQVGTAADMIAYVQWGAANQARAAVALAGGLWDAAAFLPVVAETQSLALVPGALGRVLSDWTILTPPTPGRPNVGAVSAWRGWSLLAGRAALAPALTFHPVLRVLDLAAVDAQGRPVHYRFREGAWSAGVPLNATTSLPAALATRPDGTLDLVVVGADQVVFHSRLVDGTWTAFASTGQRSVAPPALVYNVPAQALELVVVGADGRLVHSRFLDGQWTPGAPVGGSSSVPPALAVRPADGALDLIFASLERVLTWAGFSAEQWGEPEPLIGETRVRPAVAVGRAGSLEVVVTGPDGILYHNRQVFGQWSGWTALPYPSALAPTLAFNALTNTLELAAVGSNGRVAHSRFLNNRWTPFLGLGAISAATPALVKGADDELEIVVAGADRGLWHNRFRPRSEDLVSFEKEVQPIFTAYCSNCHGGQFAPGRAYGSIVHVLAPQLNTMPYVTPLSPERSYLFHKLAGTQGSVGGTGTRMPPPPREALTPEEIAKVRAWIVQGALNN
jgi:hypothetical protein